MVNLSEEIDRSYYPFSYGRIMYEPGLFLERAREPVALYFAVGLSCFAGSEPGGLSHFRLDIFD